MPSRRDEPAAEPDRGLRAPAPHPRELEGEAGSEQEREQGVELPGDEGADQPGDQLVHGHHSLVVGYGAVRRPGDDEGVDDENTPQSESPEAVEHDDSTRRAKGCGRHATGHQGVVLADGRKVARARSRKGERSVPDSADESVDAGLALLEGQEALLAPEAAAVAAEAAVGVHHPVAGNDDGDAVHAVGLSHRPDCVGRADGLRQLLVGPGLAVGDALQRLPDALLEVGAHRP